jgi:hypothetical protein
MMFPPLKEGQVQTRSEEGGVCFFNTLERAKHHATRDTTVWKISYQTYYRHVRMVKDESGNWNEETMPLFR